MLKYKCLVMDHDDTVVQSEQSVNYPYFAYILNQLRPGTNVTLKEYVEGCFRLGFADFCRTKYHFSEQELVDEYQGWKEYIKDHIPSPYKGMCDLLHKQRAEGGYICVVSHSCAENITRDYSAHFEMQPDEIFGWDLPEELRKPSTYPLEQIMQKYNLMPSDILVVDDMKPAYEMASKAGTAIAFAAWSRKDYPDLASEMKSLCNYSFETVDELYKFLFGSLTDMV